MKKWTILLVLILLLTACVKSDPTVDTDNGTSLTPPTEEEPTIDDEPGEDKANEVVDEETTNSSDFFMKNGTVAHFKGEGNEYSTYTTRTEWLSDEYVNVYEDNGGVELIKSYRLVDQDIVVLQEVPLEGDNTSVTIDELEKLTAMKTYLSFPLEVGTTIDVWNVISIDEEVETPHQLFTNVIVLEEIHKDGAISRSYFAKGFGEIKREYTSEENGETFAVTSVLERIE